MTSGNGVPTASDRDKDVIPDSQQLRDIKDLIAKLEIVNRQLSLPAQAMPAPRQADPSSADAPDTAAETTTD
jgi:hypothetical protein